MQRRYNLAYLMLAYAVLLGLMPLMVDVDAQAQIAFTSEKIHTVNIYMIDPNGRNLRRLTNNRWADDFLSWSPDGKRITFAAQTNRSWDIYVMDIDDGKNRNLTNSHQDEWEPSWSPDGKRIAFASDRERRSGIYVMDANGRNIQQLTGSHRSTDRYPVMVSRWQAHCLRLP